MTEPGFNNYAYNTLLYKDRTLQAQFENLGGFSFMHII